MQTVNMLESRLRLLRRMVSVETGISIGWRSGSQPADTVNFAFGGRLMHRLFWLAIPLSLAACGGSKSAPTLTVTCTGGIQLVGATSLDVLGDVVNGRPTMEYPDPTNPAKTGSISVDPRGHCRVTPQAPS
jgi:hypothetical protein